MVSYLSKINTCDVSVTRGRNICGLWGRSLNGWICYLTCNKALILICFWGCQQLIPCIGLYVVFVKVILSVDPVISAKHIYVVFKCHTRMQWSLKHIIIWIDMIFTGQGTGPCECSSYQLQLSMNFSIMKWRHYYGVSIPTFRFFNFQHHYYN